MRTSMGSGGTPTTNIICLYRMNKRNRRSLLMSFDAQEKPDMDVAVTATASAGDQPRISNEETVHITIDFLELASKSPKVAQTLYRADQAAYRAACGRPHVLRVKRRPLRAPMKPHFADIMQLGRAMKQQVREILEAQRFSLLFQALVLLFVENETIVQSPSRVCLTYPCHRTTQCHMIHQRSGRARTFIFLEKQGISLRNLGVDLGEANLFLMHGAWTLAYDVYKYNSSCSLPLLPCCSCIVSNRGGAFLSGCVKSMLAENTSNGS